MQDLMTFNQQIELDKAGARMKIVTEIIVRQVTLEWQAARDVIIRVKNYKRM